MFFIVLSHCRIKLQTYNMMCDTYPTHIILVAPMFPAQTLFIDAELQVALSILRPMEFSIKFNTVKSGWSIIYIEWLQAIISKIITFLSLKINFILANSADPDKMPIIKINTYSTYKQRF